MLHSTFYRFNPVPAPTDLAQEIRSMARDLLGRIVVAPQGVSGAVAGNPQAIDRFERTFEGSDWLVGAAHGMRFRHSMCTTAPFGRLSVSVKPELVALGLPVSDSISAPDQRDSSHLDPLAWRELLARQACVLIDNRNHFEYRLGHFQGAIDPQVHHFRDFVAYVQAHASAWIAQQRPVAMYCTGGIRCDVAAPWLRSLGLEVWQLDGGILNYFEALPDAALEWQGDCFVFDNRIALDTHLRESPIQADQVYDPQFPDEQWRLQRARQLERSAQTLAQPRSDAGLAAPEDGSHRP
jgi:UPF0176 protein